MDPDPAISVLLSGLLFYTGGFTAFHAFLLSLIALLLVFSGCFSGSEIAFFSLRNSDLEKLDKQSPRVAEIIREILRKPKLLLATILVGNNLVNITIVILSTVLFNDLFSFGEHPTAGFLIQVIGVTFLLLLFGEVIPKTFSGKKPLEVSLFMAYPILVSQRILFPASRVLMASSTWFEKKIGSREISLSVDELSQALEITSDDNTPETEKKLLRGIVKFGKLDVAQVMKPRPDVVALEKSTPFNKVIDTIRNSGFSRMPVYEGTLDKIAGIIHIKDLIPYSSSPPGFRWNELIRPAFFVPETKMIDDLLREFQGKKIHLAIVVDEYGGTSGIITLEDIIEEIVGEINDEFDVEEIVYSRLDPKNFVFEGKITLTDLARILNIDPEIFLQKKKESDTLAGFILEITGRIPGKNEKVVFNKLEFIIESTDGRRIKRVKVKLP